MWSHFLPQAVLHSAQTCQAKHMGPLSVLETGRAGSDPALIFLLRSEEQEIPAISFKHWNMALYPVLFNLDRSLDPAVPAAGEGAGLSRGLGTGAGVLAFPWWNDCKPSCVRTDKGTVASQILLKNLSKSGGKMIPARRFLCLNQLLTIKRALRRQIMVGNKALFYFISSLLKMGS